MGSRLHTDSVTPLLRRHLPQTVVDRVRSHGNVRTILPLRLLRALLACLLPPRFHREPLAATAAIGRRQLVSWSQFTLPPLPHSHHHCYRSYRDLVAEPPCSTTGSVPLCTAPGHSAHFAGPLCPLHRATAPTVQHHTGHQCPHLVGMATLARPTPRRGSWSPARWQHSPRGRDFSGTAPARTRGTRDPPLFPFARHLLAGQAHGVVG